MAGNLAEQMKDVIAEMLGYYGFPCKTDYEMAVFTDTIDIAALENGGTYPKIAIFCSPEETKFRFISRVARHSSIENVVVLDSSAGNARNKLPSSVNVFDLPDMENTAFEDYLARIAPKRPPFPYFNTVPRSNGTGSGKSSALEKFEHLISEQGLDLARAKYEMYRTAISGLNIRYGRYIHVDEGNPLFERNRDLSREAILLKAAGYLKEEKVPDRGLGLDSDGNSFLVLSDDEETGRLAEEIVDEYVYANRLAIRRIMSEYPKLFNYVVLVGSLGYYAPKTVLSIERHRRSWSGVIRTTAQSENSFLVEVIRTMINNVGITEEEWNRLNCLASFPEINSLVGEYFEALEKAKVGVYGYRGLRRIYLPAKRISTYMKVSEYSGSVNGQALEDFCIYDSILRSNQTGFDFRSVVADLRLDQDKVTDAVNHLSSLGYCSRLLPEGSDLPIAIYNQPKFTNHCLKVMREKASMILDIEW